MEYVRVPADGRSGGVGAARVCCPGLLAADEEMLGARVGCAVGGGRAVSGCGAVGVFRADGAGGVVGGVPGAYATRLFVVSALWA